MEFNDFRKELNDYVREFCTCLNPNRETSRNMWHDYNNRADEYEGLEDFFDCVSFSDYEPKDTPPVPLISYQSMWANNNYVMPAPVSANCTQPCVKSWNKNKEVENTMTQKTDAAVQRDYLINRLTDARYIVRANLTEQFNLYKDSLPRNFRELIEYIKSEKYTIDSKIAKRVDAAIENGEDDSMCFNAFDGIKWNARPTADFDGYNAAEKEMNKQLLAAKDVIMTSDAAAGLKALQDFEAWVPAGKAN